MPPSASQRGGRGTAHAWPEMSETGSGPTCRASCGPKRYGHGCIVGPKAPIFMAMPRFLPSQSFGWPRVTGDSALPRRSAVRLGSAHRLEQAEEERPADAPGGVEQEADDEETERLRRAPTDLQRPHHEHEDERQREAAGDGRCDPVGRAA